MTANFDSAAGCPGADGNASGCAVLLELASLLLAPSSSASPSVKDKRAKRTVWLVAFDLKVADRCSTSLQRVAVCHCCAGPSAQEWGNIGSYALAKEMRGRDAQVRHAVRQAACIQRA